MGNKNDGNDKPTEEQKKRMWEKINKQLPTCDKCGRAHKTEDHKD